MRTNVIIDEEAVAAAGEILGTPTRSETIRAAIDEVVRRKKLRVVAESSIANKHVDAEALERVRKEGWH